MLIKTSCNKLSEATLTPYKEPGVSVLTFIPCNKIQDLDYEEEIETGIFRFLKCGHVIFEPHKKEEIRKRHPILWNWLLPFQKESVEKLEKRNGRALLAHEMGLGKTVISLSYLRENKETALSKYCLIVTQAGDIFRWKEEAVIWLGLSDPSHIIASGDIKFEDLFSPELIRMFPVVYTGNGNLPPNGGVIITSWTRLREKKFTDQLKKVGISCFIVDESHMYKNPNTGRTRYLLDLISWADKNNGYATPVIFLSGTPITNRLSEFTTTLNVLDPIHFPSPQSVLRFCDYDFYSKKYLGINKYRRERFFELTRNYVFRETAESVHLPLPPLKTDEIFVNIQKWNANEQFAAEYNEILDALESEINSSQPNSGNVLGYMSQLRRCTGMMKVLDIAAFADNFLLEYPEEKLCIGVHHVTVREWLCKLLEHHNPLSMSNEPAEIKDLIEQEFKKPERRLLIASTISAGHGRNLQFCRNAVIGERLWNRELERQFMKRFHRIVKNEDGSVKTDFTEQDTVRIFTITAKNTFDEYFDTLVNLKGIIVDTSDQEVSDEGIPDQNFVFELARLMVQHRLKWVGV